MEYRRTAVTRAKSQSIALATLDRKNGKVNFLRKLRKWNDVKDYPARTVVFAEGDPADYLYIVLSGELELTISGDLLSTESAGGLVGEMAIIESAQQGAEATTLTEASLARFDRDQLSDFMHQNSEFSVHVLDVLASRLRLVDEYSTIDFKL
jgi:CRP-like cAMP-binding protein